MSISSSAPKRRKVNQPQFPPLFGADWTALPVAGSSTPFVVSLIIMDEDCTWSEYRAQFSSAEAAKRLWTFSQTVQRAESGAGCSFLNELACDTIYLMDCIKNKDTGACPKSWFWADRFAEFVRDLKLETPEWNLVNPEDQSGNLSSTWEDVAPEQKIGSVWRVVSWC